MTRDAGLRRKALNKQSLKLRVLRKFAEVCPYHIDCDSIQKRKRPEPNFVAKLWDASTLAFEVVECIDSFQAVSIWSCYHTAWLFDEALNKLPTERLNNIKSCFGDICVSVIIDEVRMLWHDTLAQPLFDYIFTLDNKHKFEEHMKMSRNLSASEFDLFNKIIEKWKMPGEDVLRNEPFCTSVLTWLEIEVPTALKRFVNRIQLLPGLAGGPSFIVSKPEWEARPVEKKLINKMRSMYRTTHQTDLLLYYEAEPGLPVDAWISNDLDSAIAELDTSIFERIWLYSFGEKKIIYVFPGLT